MRLLNAFLLLVYLSATQCCMCQSLPDSPDSGHGQPSSNSLVQDGGNSRPVRSSVYGSSCMPQEYLEPVQATFQKLIPSFDSRSITILIKSDDRIHLGPEDTLMVPFLSRYYSATITKIQPEESDLLATSMYLYFSREYARFLTRIGMPLSCISFYLGATDAQTLNELQSLTTALQRRYLPGGSQNMKCLFDKDMTGQQILNVLRVNTKEVYEPNKYLPDNARDAATCEQIIFYLRDGSLMAVLPSLNVNRLKLEIPYLVVPINLNKAGVPYQIGRYLAFGLACLDDDVQKWNFTEKVIDWMTTNVVHDIVLAPVCLTGFGGILPFIVSVQHYADSLSGNRTMNSTQAIRIPPRRLLQKLSLEKVKVRRRRSVETTEGQKSDKFKHYKARHKRQHKRTRKLEGQRNPGQQQPKKSASDLNARQKLQKEQVSVAEVQRSRQEYDQELLHLYEKVNQKFARHNYLLKRLDLLRMPEAVNSATFPPIYFHSTPKPRTTKKPTFFPPTTTTTTTTTPKPTTTTTTIISPIDNNRPTYRPGIPPFNRQPDPDVPVAPIRLQADVYMDENQFRKPLTVLVSGNKVNAHLHVMPKSHVALPGEIIHFQENPSVSSEVHPVFDFSKRSHLKLKSHPIRPLNMRKHILFKKTSRDNLPHNPIDSMLDAGFNRIRGMMPSVFGVENRTRPHMHTFEQKMSQEEYRRLLETHGHGRSSSDYIKNKYYHPQLPPPPMPVKPSVRKGSNRLNNMDRGLEDLIDADNEFPRA